MERRAKAALCSFLSASCHARKWDDSATEAAVAWRSFSRKLPGSCFRDDDDAPRAMGRRGQMMDCKKCISSLHGTSDVDVPDIVHPQSWLLPFDSSDQYWLLLAGNDFSTMIIYIWEWDMQPSEPERVSFVQNSPDEEEWTLFPIPSRNDSHILQLRLTPFMKSRQIGTCQLCFTSDKLVSFARKLSLVASLSTGVLIKALKDLCNKLGATLLLPEATLLHPLPVWVRHFCGEN